MHCASLRIHISPRHISPKDGAESMIIGRLIYRRRLFGLVFTAYGIFPNNYTPLGRLYYLLQPSLSLFSSRRPMRSQRPCDIEHAQNAA